MELLLDLTLYVFGPVTLLAILALLFGRDSRPGFDHRELRDSGPRNV